MDKAVQDNTHRRGDAAFSYGGAGEAEVSDEARGELEQMLCDAKLMKMHKATFIVNPDAKQTEI